MTSKDMSGPASLPKPDSRCPSWIRSGGQVAVYGGLALLSISVLVLTFGLPYLRYYHDGDQLKERAIQVPLRGVIWESPEPLPGPLNEVRGNLEATLSSDGTTLIVSRFFSAGNTDLFVSRQTNGSWTRPEPLSRVNTAYHERGPALSRDGQWLFFSSDRPGGFGGFDIWYSRFKDGEWQAPVNAGPEVNGPDDELDPALSPSGELLVFVSNRDARGALDLYKSKVVGRTDAGAINPESLLFGPSEVFGAVNSPFNEGKASFSRRGDMLYFSSNRPGGHGGFDLYRSRKVDGIFGPPENLGHPVNTIYDEVHPTVSLEGFGLTYSSNRRSRSPADFHVYQTVSREVAIRLDLVLVRNFLLLLLLLAVSAMLLHWLLRILLSEASMRMATRCLIASVLVHLLLAVLSGSWLISSKMGEVFRETPSLMTINTTALARESVSMAIRESVASLPQVQSSAAVERVSEPVRSLESQPTAVATPTPVAEMAVQEMTSAVQTPVSSRQVTSSVVPPANIAANAPPVEFAPSHLRMEMPDGLRQRGQGEETLADQTQPRDRQSDPDPVRNVNVVRSAAPALLPAEGGAAVAGALAANAQETSTKSESQSPVPMQALPEGASLAEIVGKELLKLPKTAAVSPLERNLASESGMLLLPAGLKMEEFIRFRTAAHPGFGLLTMDPSRSLPLPLSPPTSTARNLRIRQWLAGLMAKEPLEESSSLAQSSLPSYQSPGRIGDLLGAAMPFLDIQSDAELEVPESLLL